MKICYFNQEFPPRTGGIATFADNLVFHISKSNQVRKIISIAFGNPNPRHETNGKLEIITYRTKNLIKTFFLIFKNFWRFKKFDVFHATYIFPVGFFILILAKTFRKKFFLTIHGTDVLTKKGSKKTIWAKKITLKYCNKIIAVSESTAKKTSNFYKIPLDKFEIVYSGMNEKILAKNPSSIRLKYNIAIDDFVVLFVGRLVKRKGADDLIKAISIIENKKIKLLIVGDGPEKNNLKNLAQKLNILNRVIFAGKVDSVVNYYYSADVFSMPSKFLKEDGDIEGLGIVYIEAQYFGKPVIGTNSGGIPEVIFQNKTGFIVQENNYKEIAEKIIFLKNNKDKYIEMSNETKKFINRKFNWENSINKLLKIYKQN